MPAEKLGNIEIEIKTPDKEEYPALIYLERIAISLEKIERKLKSQF